MTDFTKWSPTCGCTPVNDGCDNCPGERAAWRLRNDAPYSFVASNGKWNGTILPHSKQIEKPLKRKKPARYLIGTMGDPFHPGVEEEWLDQIFVVMALCPQHTFLVLTKRPERALEYLTARVGLEDRRETIARQAEHTGRIVWDSRGSDYWLYLRATAKDVANRRPFPGWPLPNVHIGVLIHDQPAADDLVPKLLSVSAAKRIVWVRPRGPVDLDDHTVCLDDGWVPHFSSLDHDGLNPDDDPDFGGKILDFVVCEGERGPNAHPVHPVWVRSLRDQCAAAGVVFNFQGWGDWVPRSKHPIDGSWSASDLDPRCEKWKCVRLTESGGSGWRLEDVDGGCEIYMSKVGAKRSGRLLDGNIHDGWPE
jgi:protein gp37